MKIIAIVLGCLAVLSAADQSGITIAGSFCSLNNIQKGLIPLILPSTIEQGTFIEEISFGNWLSTLEIKNLTFTPQIDFNGVNLKLDWSNATSVFYSVEALTVNLAFQYGVKAFGLQVLSGTGKVNASNINGELSATYIEDTKEWIVVFKEDSFSMNKLQVTLSNPILNALLSLFEGWITSEIRDVIPNLVAQLNALVVEGLESQDPRRLALNFGRNIAANFTFTDRPVMDKANDYALLSFNGLFYNDVSLDTYAPNKLTRPGYYKNAWREQIHISDNSIVSALYEIWAVQALPQVHLDLSDALATSLTTAMPEFAAFYGDNASYNSVISLAPPFNWNIKNGININAQGFYVQIFGKQADAEEFTEGAIFSFNMAGRINPYSNSNYIITAEMDSAKIGDVAVIYSGIGEIKPNATRIDALVSDIEKEVNSYAGFNVQALIPPQYALATFLLTNTTLAFNQTTGYALLGVNFNIDPFTCT